MLDDIFMGVIKDLAKSCSHGSDAHRIHFNFLRRRGGHCICISNMEIGIILFDVFASEQ